MPLPSWRELQITSHANWRRLPEIIRNDCLSELRARLNESTIVEVRTVIDNIFDGKSPLAMFHLFFGMSVRNLLRQQWLDQELPGVKYPDGREYRNWDDFYMGALQDLVEYKTPP